MMYSACIFDLYGTLVDIHTDEKKQELWEQLALFYAFYGASYEPLELQRAYERLTEALSNGKDRLRADSHEAFPEIRIEEVFEQLFRAKGISADEALVRHAGQFFRILSIDHLRLYDGTSEMLATLRENGRKLYLLSNAQKIFTKYELRALNIEQYFDGIFISSAYGCKKPDLQFFETLIRTSHIDRSRAVMVGNDGVCDIAGAKRAGLSTLYVRTEISPREDLPKADHILPEMDMEKMTQLLLS